MTVLKKPLQSRVLLIMKLTSLFILFFTLNVSATGFGQDKISIRVKKAEIAGVLSTIEKQTNYRFLYNNKLEDIREKVSLNVKNANLVEVLRILLEKTRLLYEVMDNNLIVIKENPNAPERAPDVTIRGKVTGDGGIAVAGASIQVKGTTIGTTTNNEGNFTLVVPDGNVTLIVSSVGYDPQEIALAGRSEIAVGLTTSTKIMDQVVVIGYGTASRRDLTGSIVKVDGKVVADKPNTNPVASLQGKVAGLTVVNSGTPGRAPDIRIRGTNSLGGDIHPLYVVDGVFNDNIDYINPNDIESIEILKDPSSLAIFGVRGANGVIAITTKRGKAGQTLINFNTSYGIKKLVDKIEWADAETFKTLFEEEKLNIGAFSPFDYNIWNANTDWVDAVTRTGKFNANNISISSSTDKNKFYMGFGYTTDEGIIKHEKLKKILLSIADELKINKFLKLGFNINASKQDNPYGADWILDAARKVIPNVSAGTRSVYAKNPYGLDSANYNLYYELPGIQNSGVVNPLLILENEWDKTISQEYRTVASAFAEISFLKNFSFRSTAYADISNVNRRVYSPLYLAYDASVNAPFLYGRQTAVGEGDETYRKFQTDNILNYKGRIGDHNITGLLGFTTYDFRYAGRSASSRQSATGNAIPNDKRFWYVTNGFEDPLSRQSGSDQYERTTASLLMRALYNYQGKYYLNGSYRKDGSSVFPRNRWQDFWAVGAAWELTKENFMQSQRFFDFVKLKASMGVLGVQNTGGYRYPAYPLLAGGTAAVFGDLVYTAAQQAYLEDANLKWERNHSKEVGVELDAFQRRLHFDASYYTKTTKGLLSQVPQGSGLADGLLNQGALKNSGIELAASWTQRLSGDLNLIVSGNFTTFNNEVLELAGNGTPIFNGPSITRVGSPVGSFYGYIVEGLYQSYADKLNSPVNTEFVYGPGDFKFKDVNGDGIINAQDKTIIGNPTPDFTYGGSVSLTYKGFDVGVDFGGVYGNEVFRHWGGTESPFQRVNYPAFKINRWHGDGTSNWDPILGQNHRINYEISTYEIEDGSYFRIRNVQAGFNFPSTMISRIHLKSLRLFVNAQNLKTWKRNSGYSPEFGGSATQFGVDYAGNAIPLVTTFGLNVTF
ncbi:MAG: TonB-dependent receptor [Chitinophagaceae bacterium]|nr:TonB-dependent receptor [Chitinophagaceae bacterium]